MRLQGPPALALLVVVSLFGMAQAAAGLAAPRMVQQAPGALPPDVLQRFEADVNQEMQQYHMVGAAVALVQGQSVVYSHGFGVRDQATAAPVTPQTLFRVASLTKSFTSLLAAQDVDAGLLSWDEPVAGAWPDFLAPSPALTHNLRIRDLMGADSGLGEAANVEFYLSAGLDSPLDILRSLAELPVIASPGRQYNYNNTVFAAAGYVPLLAQGIPTDGLIPAYSEALRTRVLAPIGMTSAALAADPRPLGADYATPYTRNLLGGVAPLPFNSIAGAAPSGGLIASASDMSRYLSMELSRGVAPDGTRVVSERSLEETWKPHIDIALSPIVQPDSAASGYGMGWVTESFNDGRRMVWHSGAIDGSATLLGFFPEDGLGFFVVNNMQPEFGGELFNVAVEDAFLSRVFGLRPGAAATLAAHYRDSEQQLATLAAQTSPVDSAAAKPFAGYYSQGWHVDITSGRRLRVSHDVRSSTLRSLPDGSYVAIDGPLLSKAVHFSADPVDGPEMEIEGFAPLRWLTGSS